MGKERGFLKRTAGKLVAWFSELTGKDVAIAGGKGASLAEMYNNKFPIPPGFVVTSDAYKYFIESNGLQKHIMNILRETNVEDTAALEKNAAKIRQLIENAIFPEDLKEQIIDSYEILDVDRKKVSGGASQSAMDILRNSYEPPFVAVRSSATAEDLADASFAGQQETFINVKGNDELIDSIKKCLASLFTARAVYYRTKKGFEHEKTYLAVVIQKMINADKSGVIFSKNPMTNGDEVVIEAVFGLGEGIVSGRISPDHYAIDRNSNIIDEKISDKRIALTRNSSGKTEIVKLREEISKREVLTTHEIKMLAQYALNLEKHYGKPQDIEFAIADGETYIVQSRPITTKAKKNDKDIEGNVLLNGTGASPGVASGKVRIIDNLEDLDKIKEGDILVTKMTSPDMVVSMQKASAIITDEGGLTSHAAIISREMGIPAVVGTREATEKLHDGQIVSVDGFTGRIIEGQGEEKRIEIKKIVDTKTKIKVIVDLPDYAKRAAESGAKSVGLVRLEGIIASFGKHPVWYIKSDELSNYTKNLYGGLKKIAMSFEEIWIRTSDIRSDEYGKLESAPTLIEGNPMLGDHGIRFSLKNQDLFEAELKSVKEIADEFNNKKIGIMFPQVISVNELMDAKKIIAKIKMPENVRIGVMVETPASVQIINNLCEEGINFISIGSNDLTQFTLALDRNNENVQNLYDEMNPAVLNSIAYVLRRCQRYGVETSICGQAGSRKEMAKFLVENGIDSISVNADAAHDISVIVAELEKEIVRETDNNEIIAHNDKVGTQKNEKNKLESVDEEVLILKALEGEEGRLGDEYNPGIEKNNADIPVLNEAMSVETEDFNFDKTEKKNIEVFSNEEIKEIFENQEEEVFKQEIEQEIQESEIRGQVIKEQLGQTSSNGQDKKDKQQGNEVLDIF